MRAMQKKRYPYIPKYTKTLLFGKGEDGRLVRDHLKGAAKSKGMNFQDFIIEAAIEKANTCLIPWENVKKQVREKHQEPEPSLSGHVSELDGSHYPPPPSSKPV